MSKSHNTYFFLSKGLVYLLLVAQIWMYALSQLPNFFSEDKSLLELIDFEERETEKEEKEEKHVKKFEPRYPSDNNDAQIAIAKTKYVDLFKHLMEKEISTPPPKFN